MLFSSFKSSWLSSHGRCIYSNFKSLHGLNSFNTIENPEISSDTEGKLLNVSFCKSRSKLHMPTMQWHRTFPSPNRAGKDSSCLTVLPFITTWALHCRLDFILTPSWTGLAETLQGLRCHHTLSGFRGVSWNLRANFHGALPPLQLPHGWYQILMTAWDVAGPFRSWLRGLWMPVWVKRISRYPGWAFQALCLQALFFSHERFPNTFLILHTRVFEEMTWALKTSFLVSQL